MQFLVISEQLASSAWALLLGAFLALCYDALRLLRIVLLGCGMRRPKVFEKLPPNHRSGEKPPFISMLLVNIGDIQVVFAALHSPRIRAVSAVFGTLGDEMPRMDRRRCALSRTGGAVALRASVCTFEKRRDGCGCPRAFAHKIHK